MAGYAVWPGRNGVLKRLEQAIAHNCTCPRPEPGQPEQPMYSAHRMLTDQKSLNHLDYVYRIRGGYTWSEEHV